jgi:N-acetyl-gamma-glutamyl-phosphate reductase
VGVLYETAFEAVNAWIALFSGPLTEGGGPRTVPHISFHGESPVARTRIGIVGARSYTACELLNRLIAHPHAELTALMARVEEPIEVGGVHRGLRGRLDLPIEGISIEALTDRCDLVFLCLPHGPAAELARPLIAAGVKVVDLSADFRFSRAAVYTQTYKQPHPCPELLEEAVYGLPEVNRERIRGARIVGNPGCYPTSVILALVPLLRGYGGELPAAGIIADCHSGISGAGRTLREDLHFIEANEGMRPYGLPSHRHGAEIDTQLQAIGGAPIHVTFVPHLVPMDRGIQSTSHVPMKSDLPPFDELRAAYQTWCDSEPFLRLLPGGVLPNTRDVAHLNFVDIALSADPQANALIIMSAEDNLVKGASGQAIQNMNLMIGCDETTALL